MAEIKTLRKIICPHCGRWHYIYDLLERQGTEQAPVFVHPVSFAVERQYVCPDCFLPIPLAYLNCPTMFVSFYGKPSAGKTHLLTTMAKCFVDYTNSEQNEYSYAFSEIRDVPGKQNINDLLREWETVLFNPPRGVCRMLPNTLDEAQNRLQCPFDENVAGHIYPKPFLFLLKEKEERKEERPEAEEIKDMFTKDFDWPKGKVPYDWKKGLHLCFLDIAGEHCIGNVRPHIHVQWPLDLEQYHVQFMIYDPHNSRNFIAVHNRENHGNPWPELLQEAVENDTIWNLAQDNDRVLTVVLLAKFDECRVEFGRYLQQQDNTGQLRNDFSVKFQSGQNPSLEDAKDYSDHLKKFLTNYIGDNNFIARMNNIVGRNNNDVLILPISAMGMSPVEFQPENPAEAGAGPQYTFPDCLPIWVTVPMLWLIRMLEEKSKRDENWLLIDQD